ncbi:MAG: MOSC domain-containing protein [Candidatus Aminicenantia bacterium]
MKGIVFSICISSQKGTKKKEVPSTEVLTNWGIKGDAHAGKWHRQVSLLSVESINKMKEKGLETHPGDFAENITTQGINFSRVSMGDKIFIDDNVILEITQIGKECHTSCEIQKITGQCIMPKEGIFTKVIKGGIIKRGSQVEIKCQEK